MTAASTPPAGLAPSAHPRGASRVPASLTIRRALRYLAPFRRAAALKVLLLILSILPFLLVPWPVRILIDHVIEGLPIGQQPRPFPFFVRPFLRALAGAGRMEILAATLGVELCLLFLVGAFGIGGGQREQAEVYLSEGQDTATRSENRANAGFSFAGGVLGWIDARFMMRLTQRLNHHYRSRLFERLHSLPFGAFVEAKTGDSIYRVMVDTPAITELCYRLLLVPVGAPLIIVLATLVLQSVYGWSPIVLSAFSFAPISFLGTLPFALGIRRRSSASRGLGAQTTSSVEESLSNVLAVQSLGGQAHEQARFEEESWRAFGGFRDLMKLAFGAFLAAGGLAALVIGWLFLHVGDEIIAGRLSVGDFGVLLPYFAIIAAASVELGALWIRIQDSTAGLERVFHLMDLPSEHEGPGSAPLGPVRAQLCFEAVGYRYPDGTRALADVDLSCKLGEVTALVGPAGAGKTTLAYLVPRFLHPTEGQLSIDGTPLQHLALASLRAKTAFVFQETALFDATVAENLRLANPTASDDVLRHAARLAGAHDFIMALPQGYDTPLGRGGGKLSVGQRQRLSIARALVREAPILILDEPSAALDPETERSLVRALREASRERIVLVIAHRLSTVRSADQIVFLDNGRIRERGSHAELMQRPDGAYRRFVELQTGDALAATPPDPSSAPTTPPPPTPPPTPR